MPIPEKAYSTPGGRQSQYEEHYRDSKRQQPHNRYGQSKLAKTLWIIAGSYARRYKPMRNHHRESEHYH